jgi:YidC/Oxa1 family membrane protein insertase
MVAFVLWTQVIVPKMYPPKPLPPGATNVQSAPLTATNAAPSATTTPAATPTAPAAPVAPVPVANTNVPEEIVELQTPEAHYWFTSHGGGLKAVELLKFQETVTTRRRLVNETNKFATLNEHAPAPAMALLGGEMVQGDGIFELRKTDKGIHAEKKLTNGLVILKDFELSTNYLINVKVRVESHSAQTLGLPSQEFVVGTASPMGPLDNGQAVGSMWYNGSKTEDVNGASYFSRSGFMCTTREPPREYKGGSNNVAWAAAHNQFFALAGVAKAPAESIVVHRVDLPRPTGEDAKYVATNGPPPQGYETALVYPPVTMTNGQFFEKEFWLYAGPKKYETLSLVADALKANLDAMMSFSWFGFVSKPLLLWMNWLHEALRIPFGWTIVAITFIIKLVFWPFTAASTRSAKRMQALQPQLKALQEKYKDDPMKANRKMMEFYKENKINPLGSCWPMLLQIPVFFGFYQMIRSAIELRGAPWLWVGDLTKPDTLFWLPGLGFIPVLGVPGVGLPFNLLPLIMGATMLWQARLTPPSPGMDPTQQAIMKYMPLIFLVGLYNFSAGMTLYWTTNNLLTIVQTKLTKTNQPALTAPTGPPAKAQVLTPGSKGVKRKP